MLIFLNPIQRGVDTRSHRSGTAFAVWRPTRILFIHRRTKRSRSRLFHLRFLFGLSHLLLLLIVCFRTFTMPTIAVCLFPFFYWSESQRDFSLAYFSMLQCTRRQRGTFVFCCKLVVNLLWVRTLSKLLQKQSGL